MFATAPPTNVSLLGQLESAWNRSDALFELLPDDAWLEQPIPLRQPFLFYLGHLPGFAWNQLWRGLLRRPAFDFAKDDLFARGIDPPDTESPRPTDPSLWPSLRETLRYRDRVREALRGLPGALEEHEPRASEVLATVLEHELMHHETLVYMLQQLAPGRKRRPADVAPPVFDGAAAPGRVEIEGGRVTLGARRDGRFGWDNEFPETTLDVADFSIDSTPVRNSDYLDFVESGGYARRELWSEPAWAWREARRMRHPLFWRRDADGWWHRGFFEDLPLQQVTEWPAWTSLAEAQAFARWRGARLPSEPELQLAAFGASDRRGATPAERRLPGNYGFRHWAPTPVGSHADGAGPWGVRDLVGNGWEWTATTFAPFPGFRPMPHYAGYSQDFFDGRHFVLLGASWATDDRLVRRSFRNWFQPHYPYVFAKFRLARPLGPVG